MVLARPDRPSRHTLLLRPPAQLMSTQPATRPRVSAALAARQVREPMELPTSMAGFSTTCTISNIKALPFCCWTVVATLDRGKCGSPNYYTRSHTG